MNDPLGFFENRAAALTAMFDVVLDALTATVWVLDSDLVCCFSSGAVPLLDGRSHEEVIGMSAEEYLGQERAAVRLPLLRRVLAGETVTYPTTRRGSGEFEVHLSPLHRGQTVVGVVVVMADVTERNHALRAGETRLDLVVRQLPAFLWTTDRELRITELLGEAARAEHLTQVGSTLYDFWADGDHIGAVAAHERALAGESVFDESTYQGRTLQSHLEPLHGPTGEIIGVVGVAFDVTRERQLQRDLSQAQKMEAIGQLTGGIAHDFNNMLTVIAGYTDIALSRAGGDPELREALGAISAATGASANLTRQLLAFGRQQLLQPRDVDLNDAVARMLSLLSRLLGESIRVEQAFSTQRPCVHVDPSQIEQVIANLAINARDAMPTGGRLRIATREEEASAPIPVVGGELPPGRYAVLTVEDSGSGIDEASLERVFEPFFSTKKPGVGTGLGLATVYGIVTQSKGGIRVRSVLGEGATFEVYLPAADGDSRPQPQPEAPETAAAPPETYSVLLVDDDPAVRRLVRLLLERTGHSVTAVGSADEALEQAGVFDVVVTDYVLPGMDGAALIAELRARSGSLVPAVLTSGWTRAQELHHAEHGAAQFVFLRKPFDAEELETALRRAVGR